MSSPIDYAPPIAREQTQEDLRSRLMTLALPISLAVGTLFFAVTHAHGLPPQIQAFGFLLAVLVIAVALISMRHEGWARWVLVAGYLGLAVGALIFLGRAELLVLLAIPVGVGVVIVGLWLAAGLAALETIAILLAGEWMFPGALLARSLALVMIWCFWGLAWLLLHYAAQVNVASSANYQQMREQLEAARDQRVSLKQTQEDLVQSNLELARLTDRLAAMRRAAEDAKRVKEEFVANVSHELRTPLNMIIGFAESIVNSPQIYGPNIPHTLLADLQVIYRNSQHLSSLIDDILDLSQIEAGRWALIKERVLLAEIVEAATVAVRPLYQNKALYLRSHLPSTLPPIFCARTRIREVILNLLSNAGRFTAQGGVEITAWRQGTEVVVRVSDTGPGIAPEDQERLFRPFEQVDSSLRRRYGGSGLGLSIGKAFVELHGGKMWVESKVGVGTSFFFRLPINPPAEIHSDFERWFQPYVGVPERHRQPAASLPPVLPRYVVLDEQHQLQRLLQRYVDQVEVVSVSEMEQAMSELRQRPARALLVNAGPGEEVWTRLSQNAELPYGTPAIICSFPPLQTITTGLGVSDYLVKPISSRRLLSALEDLNLSGNTVLIVDDEPDALRLFHRILTSAERGYQVLRASDGDQAVEIIQEEHPDVILLDLIMPNMDGFRFLEWRNQIPAVREIPVLVTSAKDPSGQPIVSSSLRLVRGGGLSVAQVLACIEALIAIAGPAGAVGHREHPGTSPD